MKILALLTFMITASLSQAQMMGRFGQYTYQVEPVVKAHDVQFSPLYNYIIKGIEEQSEVFCEDLQGKLRYMLPDGVTEKYVVKCPMIKDKKSGLKLIFKFRRGLSGRIFLKKFQTRPYGKMPSLY